MREQQFEPLAHGSPPWLQPPGASRHRPGKPPLDVHMPEQQSALP
jgi:hypothetical protein